MHFVLVVTPIYIVVLVSVFKIVIKPDHLELDNITCILCLKFRMLENMNMDK